MTILDVAKLIERLSPSAICDDCIADKLGFDAGQDASQCSRGLAGTNGFERKKDACSICDSVKPVVRKVR